MRDKLVDFTTCFGDWLTMNEADEYVECFCVSRTINNWLRTIAYHIVGKADYLTIWEDICKPLAYLTRLRNALGVWLL